MIDVDNLLKEREGEPFLTIYLVAGAGTSYIDKNDEAFAS
jgi:hypothetical protein